MRMIFGLTGVLVVLGIFIWIFNSIEYPIVKQSEKPREQAQTWAGQTDTGRHFQDTYATNPELRPDGKPADLRITRIDADSPLGKVFHAQVNDAIVGFIDSHGLKQETPELQTPGDADTQLLEVCLNPGQIIVNRAGSVLLLPDGTAAGNLVHMMSLATVTPAPTPTPQPAAAPPQTQPTKPAVKNPGEETDQPTETDPLSAIRRRLKPIGGGE